MTVGAAVVFRIHELGAEAGEPLLRGEIQHRSGTAPPFLPSLKEAPAGTLRPLVGVSLSDGRADGGVDTAVARLCKFDASRLHHEAARFGNVASGWRATEAGVTPRERLRVAPGGRSGRLA